METISQEIKKDVSLAFSLADDSYCQAVAIMLRDRKASTSYIQCRLGIGYNRTATLIERIEEEGIIISPANDMGKRKVLEIVEEEYF